MRTLVIQIKGTAAGNRFPHFPRLFLCFQIPISALVSFVEALEVGYSKHKNPYHNLMHAADVTQTVHYLLLKTGMVVSRSPDQICPGLNAASINSRQLYSCDALNVADSCCRTNCLFA